MFQIRPTKRGLGAELWGDYDSLEELYDVIAQFWDFDEYREDIGFENRDKIISGFVHEIRKGYEGSRLIQKDPASSYSRSGLLGCRWSWVHVFFALGAIRFNMRSVAVNQHSATLITELEAGVKKALVEFDPKTGSLLLPYVADALYQGNPYGYQIMRNINADYFSLGGGKVAFRKLPGLLQHGVFESPVYRSYLSFLTQEAKRLECGVEELELEDDHISYHSIVW